MKQTNCCRMWMKILHCDILYYRSESSFYLQNLFIRIGLGKYVFRPVCSPAGLLDRPGRYARLAVEYIGPAGLLA